MTSLVEANIFTTAEAEETGTFLLLYLQFGVRAWMPLQYSLQESLLRRNKSILKRNFLQKMISKHCNIGCQRMQLLLFSQLVQIVFSLLVFSFYYRAIIKINNINNNNNNKLSKSESWRKWMNAADGIFIIFGTLSIGCQRRLSDFHAP